MTRSGYKSTQPVIKMTRYPPIYIEHVQKFMKHTAMGRLQQTSSLLHHLYMRAHTQSFRSIDRTVPLLPCSTLEINFWQQQLYYERKQLNEKTYVTIESQLTEITEHIIQFLC